MTSTCGISACIYADFGGRDVSTPLKLTVGPSPIHWKAVNRKKGGRVKERAQFLKRGSYIKPFSHHRAIDWNDGKTEERTSRHYTPEQFRARVQTGAAFLERQGIDWRAKVREAGENFTMADGRRDILAICFPSEGLGGFYQVVTRFELFGGEVFDLGFALRLRDQEGYSVLTKTWRLLAEEGLERAPPS
jgi:hypothetical protein